MSLRKTWFLLILFFPFQSIRPAQLPANLDCRFEGDHQETGRDPQLQPPLDNVNPAGQKPAQIPQSPTRSKIMAYRYMALREALLGYCETHVPLVASDGARYFPAGFSDDPGIYYFIPRLAFLTHLKLSNATDVFFAVPQIVSFLIALVFLLPRLESPSLKLWAILLLLVVTSSSIRRGDVYSVQTVTALAIVPWSLHLVGKKTVSYGSAVFVAGAGTAIGIANMIRSQAATGIMIFLAVIVGFHGDWPRKQKLALLAALVVGFAIPAIYFHSLLTRRDQFLAVVQPDSMSVLDRHPFWHSVYIGFSFVPNKYVPEYRDELVFEKVRSIDPSARYYSPEYERIVRAEVFQLVRDHPLFALGTMLAKLGAIGYLLLISSNLGLIASALYPKPWPVEAAFWSAMGFNSLFGLVVIPHRQYMLGFTTLAVLYGIVSIGYALELRRAAKIPQRPCS